MAPIDLVLGPRECLWVNDWRTTRISVFDPTEGFVVSFRYENSLAGSRLLIPTAASSCATPTAFGYTTPP